MVLPRFILDINIALYLLNNRLEQPLPPGVYFASFITEMELLSYPELTDAQTQDVRDFLSSLTLVTLGDAIKDLAIQWRWQYRLKLPDAIIVATALHLQAILLTNDQQLTKLQGLPTQSLALRL